MTRLARSAFLWLCAGIGLDIGQRVFDHWLDGLAQSVTWLAWLN